MKFIFPDAQDFVDPSFDFTTERRANTRLRMRDDLYAHELFRRPPFDGLLISKAIVDGAPGAPGKYSIEQRQRLLRDGARAFFRLDERKSTRHLTTIGDCGAFSYVREDTPPVSVTEVLDFYDRCGFDAGISVDHVILGYDAGLDSTFPGMPVVAPAMQRRQQITLDLAADFRRAHVARRLEFTPVGVAQGWSPASYAAAVRALQQMGYARIALGGMVPLKTPDILAVLEAADAARRPGTTFHLLGVTRTDHVEAFSRYGVTSFDTTSPFRRAFKDAKENYYTFARTYTALRVPQVDENNALKKLISSGRVDQHEARRLERACLATIRGYDRGEASVDDVLDVLHRYEQLYGEDRVDRSDRYRATLTDRPWARCACDVCRAIGVEVIIFRGSERNKRRGFHNIYVLNERLHHELAQVEQLPIVPPRSSRQPPRARRGGASS